MPSRSASGGPRRTPSRPTPKPKPTKVPANAQPVPAEEVNLVRTKGTAQRGGGPGGEAWRIEVAGKRAGVVFINLADKQEAAPYPAIEIYLNTANQGRRIGRTAYLKACRESAYNVIYAHMQKANKASARAAEEAGFNDETPAGNRQKVMVWRRDRST